MLGVLSGILEHSGGCPTLPALGLWGHQDMGHWCGSGVLGDPRNAGGSWGKLRALWGLRIPEGGQGLGDPIVTPNPFLCSLQEAPGTVSGGLQP